MSRDVLLEGLGYLASVLVAVSLMMRSIIRLRWFSLVGATCFTIYGALISAYPVAGLNFAIVLINVYFLVSARRTDEEFSLLTVRPGSPYLREFLAFHGDDIARFQPRFAFDPDGDQHVLMVLRDMVPAGVLILRPGRDGAASVDLDFVTPAYRDFKVGSYLFNRRRDVFENLGIDRIESPAGSHRHAAYLKRMGFVPSGNGYALDLGPPARGGG